MSKLMEKGFASKEQEMYLMKNQPELYKRVLNKFGHFGSNHSRKPLNIKRPTKVISARVRRVR